MHHNKKTDSLNTKTLFVFIFLFLIALLCRLPYFFQSVIDWDESTQIILGQDLLNGHLPYTHLWANKPPLAFVPYAFFILLFGKSMLGIRLGGMLCVFISACIVYKTGHRIRNSTVGLCSALLLIVFSSTFSYGGSTATEHLTFLPTSLILLLLFEKNNTRKNIFLMGLLCGILILIRTNMAYFTIGLGLIIFIRGLQDDIYRTVYHMILFLFSVLIFPFFIVGIYSLHGHFDLLIRSTVTAPLTFINDFYPGMIDRILATRRIILQSFTSTNFSIWLSFILGIVIIYSKKDMVRERKTASVILTLFLFTLLSIIQTGYVFEHHLIQLIPFMAIIGGLGLLCISHVGSKIPYIFLIIFLIMPSQQIYREYTRLFNNVQNKKSLFADTAFNIAAYLNQYNISGQYVFFCDHHIGYWLTNTQIPTKYVHPSNLVKAPMLKAIDGLAASPEDELQKIFAKEPQFIIKPERLWYFDKFNKQCNIILDEEIKKHYYLDTKINDVSIYRRRKM